MVFVVHRGVQMPAVQAMDIPWDANRDPVALRAVGDQWTDLVAPSRAQEALKQNLETLTTCLDGTGRRSLFHTDLTPPTELTMIGAIDSYSPIDTYEQKNLFDLLHEMASTDGTVTQYPDGFLIQNSFGSIGAYRGRQIWENTTRVPIAIEGTVIPKGTLCQVKKDGDTIEWVKPLRLTLFNLPLDGEGAEVFQHHLYKLNRFGQSDDDVRAVYRALDNIA